MKLVRDKIPEIIGKDGKKPKTHKANSEEYWQELLKKLKEETNEFIEDPNKEELADILEVVQAIIKRNNWDENDIDNIRQKKLEERGSFDKKIILE